MRPISACKGDVESNGSDSFLLEHHTETSPNGQGCQTPINGSYSFELQL